MVVLNDTEQCLVAGGGSCTCDIEVNKFTCCPGVLLIMCTCGCAAPCVTGGCGCRNTVTTAAKNVPDVGACRVMCSQFTASDTIGLVNGYRALSVLGYTYDGTHYDL